MFQARIELELASAFASLDELCVSRPAFDPCHSKPIERFSFVFGVAIFIVVLIPLIKELSQIMSLGKAIDVVRTADLEKFILANLETLDIWIEDLDVTLTWIHVQIVPPKSGNRVFKP